MSQVVSALTAVAGVVVLGTATGVALLWLVWLGPVVMAAIAGGVLATLVWYPVVIRSVRESRDLRRRVAILEAVVAEKPALLCEVLADLQLHGIDVNVRRVS